MYHIKNYGKRSEVWAEGRMIFLGTYDDCQKYVASEFDKIIADENSTI